jgi:hypothetical protein
MYIGVGRPMTCRECKRPINGRNSNAVYCSSACSERWHARNRKHQAGDRLTRHPQMRRQKSDAAGAEWRVS